jgi:hypothetical protein
MPYASSGSNRDKNKEEDLQIILGMKYIVLCVCLGIGRAYNVVATLSW